MKAPRFAEVEASALKAMTEVATRPMVWRQLNRRLSAGERFEVIIPVPVGSCVMCWSFNEQYGEEVTYSLTFEPASTCTASLIIKGRTRTFRRNTGTTPTKGRRKLRGPGLARLVFVNTATWIPLMDTSRVVGYKIELLVVESSNTLLPIKNLNEKEETTDPILHTGIANDFSPQKPRPCRLFPEDADKTSVNFAGTESAGKVVMPVEKDKSAAARQSNSAAVEFDALSQSNVTLPNFARLSDAWSNYDAAVRTMLLAAADAEAAAAHNLSSRNTSRGILEDFLTPSDISAVCRAAIRQREALRQTVDHASAILRGSAKESDVAERWKQRCLKWMTSCTVDANQVPFDKRCQRVFPDVFDWNEATVKFDTAERHWHAQTGTLFQALAVSSMRAELLGRRQWPVLTVSQKNKTGRGRSLPHVNAAERTPKLVAISMAHWIARTAIGERFPQHQQTSLSSLPITKQTSFHSPMLAVNASVRGRLNSISRTPRLHAAARKVVDGIDVTEVVHPENSNDGIDDFEMSKIVQHMPRLHAAARLALGSHANDAARRLADYERLLSEARARRRVAEDSGVMQGRKIGKSFGGCACQT